MNKLVEFDAIDAAEQEAVRFLGRVKSLRMAAREASPASHRGGSVYPTDLPILNGALKRASMDLTRALVAVRRPPL